jgi:uncharacterized protein (TIGR03066 family)
MTTGFSQHSLSSPPSRGEDKGVHFREISMKMNSDRWRDTLKEAVDREVRKNSKSYKGESEEQQEASVRAQPKPTPHRRLWIFLLLCLASSTLVSFVVFKYIAPTIPHELIGTWQVAEGPLKGATLEFLWHGTAIATSPDKQGKKETTDSSVKVEGKTIYLTSADGVTGKRETVTQTILKLSEDELVIRDEDRKTYAMTRVRH